MLDLQLDLFGQARVVAEEVADVLLALTQLIAVVGEPGSGLAHNAVVDAHIDEAALAGDAVTVEDVEFGLLERRGDLVLHDLRAGPVADRVLTFLEGLDAADVDAHGGVELQCLTARGGLRRTEEDADLLTQLVDEDRGGLRLSQGAGDLTQRLRHQTGLQTDVAVAHLAFDFGLGHECRDGVDDDDVEGPGADEHIGDLERLLTGVRLGDEELIGVDAELLRILRVEGVLSIDEPGDSAGLLCVCDGVESHGRLTGGFRTVDLDDATARQTADAQSDVESDRTGRDGGDGLTHTVAEAHDRALAVIAIDLAHCGFECLRLVSAGGNLKVLGCTCHDVSSSLLFL